VVCEVGRAVAEFRHREHGDTLRAVSDATKRQELTPITTSVKVRTALRLPPRKRNGKSVIPILLEPLARATLKPEIKSMSRSLTHG